MDDVGMTKEPQASNPRALNLNEVRFLPRSFKNARFVVNYRGYAGESTRLGAELISEVSLAQKKQANPTFLFLLNHEKNPGDVVGVPTMKESDSALPLEWTESGRRARANFAKLFALKSIEIPDGTNMIIELYEDVDSEYGPVVGMKLQTATFEPMQKKAPRSSGNKPA